MGKRSDYARVPRDYYPTPMEPVKPLVPFLENSYPDGFTFCEPCAGDGRLINHIETLTGGKCVSSFDIEPMGPGIVQKDARDLVLEDLNNADVIITNPPWGRLKKHDYILHTLITIFSDLRPTWLLFDADWVHTIQSKPFVEERLCKIVSIGRVKWIENSAGTGKDNCCWYLFDKDKKETVRFYGR